MPTSAAPLPVDVKRQIVYASLLKFAGEAQHLRDRAIDSLVLAALCDSDGNSPKKVGEIQSAITVGDAVIRPEVIARSLQRLETTGLVQHSIVKLKRVYYLTASGATEVAPASADSEQLLNRVLVRTMRGIPADLDVSAAAQVFRRFLGECFARIGLEIAKTVTGRIEREDLVKLPQVIEAFKAACAGHQLSSAAFESLEARCSEFLRSEQPDDERLKLYLTRGFFFSQLLGIGAATFDPLKEEAFSGAVFYLDTNTLLPGLLQSGAGPVFAEIRTVSSELGINLRVTRATLDEARRVAADREKQLRTILAEIPDELLERAHDQFVDAFLERRDREGCTVETFFAPFQDLSNFVQTTLGIELEDVVEEEMLKDASAAVTIGDVIQVESEAIRKHKKGQLTLNHDVAHFVFVQRERESNAKTWFLTYDRSIIRAAVKLAENPKPPICFSITGFLQTISPFVTSSSAQRSLADMFTGMLTTDIGGLDGGQYDVEELVVLADLHEDVISTRDEKLVQALDYVRSHSLRGEPFRAENAQKTALELKKFLTASSSEREKQVVAERERLRANLSEEKTKLKGALTAKDAAEQRTVELVDQVVDLQTQIDLLRAADQDKTKVLEQLQRDLIDRDRRKERLVKVAVMLIGLICVFWNDRVTGSINALVSFGEYWDVVVRATTTVGLIMIAVPALLLIAGAGFSAELSTLGMIGVLAAVYALLPGVKDGWQQILDPLHWIGALVAWLLARRR